MGDSALLANAGEIVEGPDLACNALAAVIAWNDVARPPLLRLNPRHVSEAHRARVFRWARDRLVRGRRLAVLPLWMLEGLPDGAP